MKMNVDLAKAGGATTHKVKSGLRKSSKNPLAWVLGRVFDQKSRKKIQIFFPICVISDSDLDDEEQSNFKIKSSSAFINRAS
jgi:hypothetical protein